MFNQLSSYLPTQHGWETVSLSLLLAFLCSSLIAKTYELTYRGLSWSPGLVQALVLGSLASCMIMLAIGNNIAGAVGIIGSLAIIRFRTNLRDPRDMVFVFAALGSGVAAGLLAFPIAVAGSVAFCMVAALLKSGGFGTQRQHDGLLRFQLPVRSPSNIHLAEVLRRNTRRFALVTMREVSQGQLLDYSYQVRLPRGSESGGEGGLLAALGSLDGLEGLSYMNQQTTVEI